MSDKVDPLFCNEFHIMRQSKYMKINWFSLDDIDDNKETNEM